MVMIPTQRSCMIQTLEYGLRLVHFPLSAMDTLRHYCPTDKFSLPVAAITQPNYTIHPQGLGLQLVLCQQRGIVIRLLCYLVAKCLWWVDITISTARKFTILQLVSGRQLLI